MKKIIKILILSNAFNVGGMANQPFQLETPLTMDIKTALKLVRDNINGWSKLSIDKSKSYWTPQKFYMQNISDPQKWIAQINQLGFCQPDKAWKNFPVLSVANQQISDSFEQVAQNPNLNQATQMMYSETVIANGKSRNVSYDYSQNGANVNITCSAANELGEKNSIQQSFDIRNPQKFEVQQKKNGKLIEI